MITPNARDPFHESIDELAKKFSRLQVENEELKARLNLRSPGHAPCDSCPEWGVCGRCGHVGYTEAAYQHAEETLAKAVNEAREDRDRHRAILTAFVEALELRARTGHWVADMKVAQALADAKKLLADAPSVNVGELAKE